MGTSIVTRAGPPVVVKGVSWQRDETGRKPFTVYNLTVQGDHTYFAGTLDGGAWAHNVDCEAAAEALRNAEPIGSALKGDAYHNAATFMRDEAAENGTHFDLIGGDGVTRTLTQIPGGLNGMTGRYEYIVDQAGKLVHQLFVENGTINGIPNVP